MTPIRKFVRFIKPYRGRMALGIACILVSLAFGLLVPYLVGVTVDALSVPENITCRNIGFYALLIPGVNLVVVVFLVLQRYMLINSSRCIEFDMREAFYESVVNQPASFF